MQVGFTAELVTLTIEKGKADQPGRPQRDGRDVKELEERYGHHARKLAEPLYERCVDIVPGLACRCDHCVLTTIARGASGSKRREEQAGGHSAERHQ